MPNFSSTSNHSGAGFRQLSLDLETSHHLIGACHAIRYSIMWQDWSLQARTYIILIIVLLAKCILDRVNTITTHH